MKLYGPKTCASVKKAKSFFDKNQITYEFIDISKEKINEEKISYWNNFYPAKSMINPRSKAYRNLKLKDKKLDDKQTLNYLVKENLLLKRPVIEHGLNGEEKLTIGFNEEEYKATFIS